MTFTAGPETPSYDELRSRNALARSVLGHAPGWRAVRKALAALDGASLEELAADQAVSTAAPDGPENYLKGWNDGWEAGYATGMERRGEVDGTAP